LITPSESKAALEASLAQNPHLTSLPSPRPTVIAPAELTMTSGTAEVFRCSEVRDVVTSDFLVLPVDLLTELSGLALLQEWMATQASFDGAAVGTDTLTGQSHAMSSSGERIGRRGGLGVWYDTKAENGIKKEQTDFLGTVPFQKAVVSAAKNSLRGNVSSVVASMPTDSLKDRIEEDKGLVIRYSLLEKFPNVSLRSKWFLCLCYAC